MSVPFTTVETIVRKCAGSSAFSDPTLEPAAFVIEFDELSRFNYLIGHDIDERILAKLYTKIGGMVPDGGIVERIGTYRFALFLFFPKDRLHRRAKALAEAFIDMLKEPLHIDEHLFYVTATVGIAFSDVTGREPYRMLKSAEHAMRTVQKEGKNYIAVASDQDTNELFARELALLRALPQSLDNNEFFFLYQPQYNPHTERFEGAEMLARWEHPELGFVSPGEFIPLAEKSGMIIPLTLRLLTDAAETFAMLEKAGRSDFSIAVNIAPDMLLEHSFLENISILLDAYGLKSRPLTFEIMEDTVAQNMEGFVSILRQLKTMGVRLALDDYGTGHTSFHHLLHLPIDTLKIDRSFVQEVDKDTKRHALLKSMMEMAHALEFKVVVEGVETDAEANAIEKLGRCVMQGFRFARPMSRDEMLALLS